MADKHQELTSGLRFFQSYGVHHAEHWTCPLPSQELSLVRTALLFVTIAWEIPHSRVQFVSHSMHQCHGVIVSYQENVLVLNPGTLKCDLIWKEDPRRCLVEVILELGGLLMQYDWYPSKQTAMRRHRNTGRMPRDGEGRDGSDAVTRQGMRMTAGQPAETRKRQGRILLQFSEGAWPHGHLYFRL